MKKILLLVIIFFCCVLCRAENKVFYAEGTEKPKRIALTFDDGPGKTTEKILEILKNKKVKATFFMLGSKTVKKPMTAKKVAEEGHEIANHTYDHVNFFKYDAADKSEKIKDELLKSEKAIQKASGITPFLVRYPHGYAKRDAVDIAKENGYYVINWYFGCDWDLSLTDEEMYEKYISNIKSGAIFLMHDTNTKAVNILSDFIDKLEEEGYEIVTVGELLGLKRELEKEMK
ncbi:MAG: polysaccharide deacetylase family protein [Endomicrobium sp.]|jgi:peptidoglycan/xylan/chitin deacetylase (PgdA/CDA1 family)|nr:polysaccharide deacetylase family protein [Endomicrobium sp.]